MPSALFGALCLLAWSTIAAEPPTREQLRALVRDLDAADFAAREAAATRLAEAGDAAIPYLAESVTRGSAEAAWRASAILASLRSADHPANGVPVSSSVRSVREYRLQQPAADVNEPAPPPEADIAAELQPPPEPVSVEQISEQVLIADAYVSPDLSGVVMPHAAPLAPHAPAAAVGSLARVPGNGVIPGAVSNPRRVRPATASVSFVRQQAVRDTIAATPDTTPRLTNFFQRARTVLGLSGR
jgi:hypothetical protein